MLIPLPTPARPVLRLVLLLLGLALSASLASIARDLMTPRNFCDTPYLRARMDLDTIRNAVQLYESQNPPLTGSSLEPLVGRYLQELPVDPWGREYLLIPEHGLILTLGADDTAGGYGTDGEDADHLVQYKKTLR